MPRVTINYTETPSGEIRPGEVVFTPLGCDIEQYTDLAQQRMDGLASKVFTSLSELISYSTGQDILQKRPGIFQRVTNFFANLTGGLIKPHMTNQVTIDLYERMDS